MDHHGFGVRASRHQTHDPITGREARTTFPQFIDDAGVLEARHIGYRARGSRIEPTPLQQIGPVQADRSHLDPHVKRGRLGGRSLHDLQHVGLSGHRNRHDTHTALSPGGKRCVNFMGRSRLGYAKIANLLRARS